jgi:hypothetical protein
VTEALPGALPATAGTGHDQVPAVAAAALEALRITDQDPDAGRIKRHAAAAASAIDQRLQLLPVAGRWTYDVSGMTVVTYGSGQAPPDVLDAAVQLTITLLNRSKAPLGVLTAGMDGPTYVSRDALAQVDSLLAPYAEGVGLA